MRKKFTFWNSTEGSLIAMNTNIFEIQRFAFIRNSKNDTIITGTSSDDNISSSGANVTINALGGNDKIQNGQSNSYTHNVTIDGGAGNDTIDNYGNYTAIDGGDDNDTIKNYGNYSFIDSGKGDDSIRNSGENSTINSGDGNDTVSNGASSVTINTGDGDDSISSGYHAIYASLLGGKDILINAEDGNDTVISDSSNSTIDGGAGNDYITINSNGDFSVIIGGKDNDTVISYGSDLTIDGGNGDDYISLSSNGQRSVIDGGSGDDTVFNGTRYSLFDSVKGADSVTIDGGEGNDIIENNATDVSISGGYGNDSISNYASNVTINAGVGDDSIYNQYGTVVYEYTEGDGNDIIEGFKANDTLWIGSENYTSLKSGRDLIFTIGEGSITLKDAVGFSPIILPTNQEGSDDDDDTLSTAVTIHNTISNKVIKGSSYADSIFNNGAYVTIKGNSGDDSISNVRGSVSINGGAGNDNISIYNGISNVTINSGSGNDIIKNTSAYGYASANIYQYNEGDGNDIIYGLTSEDTLLITGTSTTIKSGNNTIIKVGDGSITLRDTVLANTRINNTLLTGTSNANNIFNRGNNVTIESGEDDDYISNYGSNVTIKVGAGDDYIYNSGSKVTIDAGNGNDSISNYASNVTINAGVGDDSIHSYGDNVTINANSGDDSIDNDGRNVIVNAGDGNDDIVIDGINITVNAGKGDDTIHAYYYYFGSNKTLYQYAEGDGNDIIYGFTDSDTLLITSGTAETVTIGNDVVVKVGTGSITLVDYNVNVIYNTESDTVLTGTSGNDSIINSADNVTVNAGKGDDKIINYPLNVNRNAVYKYASGDGNDTIYGFRASDKLLITSGIAQTVTVGSDVIVKVGNGSITLSDFASVSHTVADTVITGTDYADHNRIHADNVMVNSGKGNDTIYNQGSNVTINSGLGEDDITNWGSNVTINADAGEDSISNYGKNSKINGGNGNDTIYNSNSYSGGSSENVSINGGIGDDLIKNNGSNVTIDAGAGNDTISNTWDENFILWNENVSINGGDGDDYIFDYKSINVTIKGGKGNDTLYGDRFFSNIYQYTEGDGNDVIYKFGSGDTLIIDGASYDIGKSSNDIIIKVGEGFITLKDTASLSSFNIQGTLNDDTTTHGVSVNNTLNNTLIKGTIYDESIFNRGNNVTINGGLGDDTIYGNSLSADVYHYIKDDGNDVIYNFGVSDTLIVDCENYMTIKSGKDLIVNVENGSITIKDIGNMVPIIHGILGVPDDLHVTGATLTNFGYDDTLMTGSNEDDYISNSGSNVTINVFAGNDKINNRGTHVTITGGSGNDSIFNYNASDVIITGNKGNDSIYNRSATYVTLIGDAGEDTIYNYSSSDNVIIYGGDDNDSVKNYGSSNITIDAGSGNDIVEIKEGSNSVTINAGDGDDTITSSYSSNLSINGGAGDDYIDNSYHVSGLSSINGGEGNDTISNSANGTIDGGEGNDSIGNSGINVYINGGNGDNIISNSGSDVSINVGEGNDNVANYGTNVTIDSGNGDDVITSSLGNYNVSINSGAGNDVIYNSSDKVTITTGQGNDTITLDINKFPSQKTLTFTDFGIDDIVTLSDTITEISFNENSKILTLDDKFEISLPNIDMNVASWAVEDNVVTYTMNKRINFVLAEDGKSITCAESSVEAVFTITGLKSDLTVVDGKIDGITLEDKKVTVSETVLEGKDVTITEGYELALSDEVKAPEKSVASWSVSNGTAKYKDGDTTAGYVVEDGKIVYKPASVGETLITIEGLSADATTDGISLTDKTVTLSESVLDKKEGTISEGYTLALADDVITPKTGEPSWSIADNIATYKAGDTTAGYILSDNKISYEESKVGENIFTVSGVKSLEGLTLNEKVITVAESALNESEVTIDGEGYSLAIANDVDSPVINSASWSVTNGTATCQGSRTAGYTLENNKIIYHAAVTDEALITVTGLKDDAQISGISLNGTTVTLSESVLDEKETTISAGYTLALADDVTKTTTGAGSWSIANDTATYKAGDVTAGYSVTDNKIAYASAKVGENLVTVNGVKSVDGLTLKDKVVTVAESSLDEKEVSISNDYTLALASGVSKPTATNPAWTVTNGTATYRLSGKTEGYTLDNGKILYSTAVEGETSITISGLKNTATATNISLNNDTLNIANAAIGTGTITVTAPDSVKKVTVGGAGNFTFDGQTFSVDTAAEFTLDSNKVNGYKVTGNGAAHLNNTYSNLTITGGNGADVISVSGSGSQNTVIGSGGNDTLYSNGSSNVFQYTSGAGNDVIYNLGNKDTVQVASGNVDSIYAEKGGDVIVTVGANKITLKNRAGQTITVKNAAGTVTSQSYTYTEPAKPSTPTPAIPSTPSTPSTNTTTRTTTTITPSTTPSSSSSSASTTSSSSGSSSSSSSTRTPSSSSSSSSWSSGSSSGSTTRMTTTSPTTTRSSSSSGGSTSRSTSSSSSSSASSGSLSSTTTTQTQATSTSIQKSEDGSYDYTGGNKTVSNYTAEDKVKLSSDFAGIDVSGNNFVIKSSSGALTLENVRDQVINVTDSEGNTTAYVYMASGGGDIDGSSLDTFEVIVGSEAESNNIKAGNGGSSLVGGGGDNTLQGGNGQDTFKYSAGTNVITNYQSGEILNFAATYTGWTTDGNDLVINAAEGSVRISEATDKLVSLADANGNLLAYVYKSGEYEGVIDGRGFGTFEVIVGSDNVSNQIFADTAGSSLWGGRGSSNDDLYGNIGADEYVYAYGNGQDNIYQAGNEDTVNLLNVSLDQISGAAILDNGVNLLFTDGGSLNISGQVGNFKLEGQVYHADYQTKSWS